MRARITIVIDMGTPEKWRRWQGRGKNRRRVPDTRPLALVARDRLLAALIGVEEYSAPVLESDIEVLS